MDIDFLKYAPDDHLDMMMMMQMDKLPDFFGDNNNVSANDASEIPTFEFAPAGGSGGNNIGSLLQITDNPHATYGIPSATSFSALVGNQQQGMGPPFRRIPGESEKRSSMAAMREMIFRIAAMQPIHIDPESVKPPKRRNVKISKDPQSVAARHRRERISERIRILQRLVPGGTKMDTASMLDEAIHYVKFLKNQVQSLERAAANRPAGVGFPVTMASGTYLPMATKGYQTNQGVHHYSDA